MNTNVFVQGKTWLFMFLFLFVGVVDVRAEILLTDSLSVTGFARQMFGVHAAGPNPNNKDSRYSVGQEDNNWLNISRTQIQTEWTYEPTDTFKLFANMRFIWDQTDSLDSNLESYDAFPLSSPHYGSTLRAGHDEEVMAEIWELYADLTLGPLWLRMGKQQIVWGEMFGWRIMDTINPLDLSWHFRLEPEEFQHIRIPQWSIRAVYNIEQNAISWLRDLYIEGFLNPGDVFPNRNPDPGAPFRFSPYKTYDVLNQEDHYGDEEFGFRLGYRIGDVAGTLNYLKQYSQTGIWQYTGQDAGTIPGPPFGPPGDLPSPPWPPGSFNNFYYDVEYPKTDIYGMTLNYAFDIPINTVLTIEGKCITDQAYYNAEPEGTPPPPPFASFTERKTWNYGVQLQRFTFVFPRPISAMNIALQFNQTIIEGDEDTIKFTPGPHDDDTNSIDKRKNQLGLNCMQFFWYNQIVASFKVLYNLEGAYLINPGFKYRYGDYWYFDLYANFLGGSDRRAGSFGSTYWADDVYARITYQF